MALDFDPKVYYLDYVKQNQVEVKDFALNQLTGILDNCQWEEPQTALDWNNLAVAALVAAEGCDNSLTHGLYAEIALDAVQAGSELGVHPLCAAHLALLNSMLGNYNEAAEIAFNAFINNLQPTYTEDEIPPGIVYIPPLTTAHITNGRSEQLQRILNTDNGYTQALLLLAEVLCRTQIGLDNPIGIRLLHLLNQLMPDLIFPNVRLGVYSIGNQELEGILYLHRACELASDHPLILQALYLAYRDLDRNDRADYWWEIGADYGRQRLVKQPWKWTELAKELPFTYIPYDRDLVLSIPASLQSVTTRCLLAEGDWFERELEFWREYIKPEMQVIDVGAGVGIYTFSAAKRVGKNGKVYAIEPYSAAVDCLRQTCTVNQIDGVKVFRNAASNHYGKVKLVVQASSELNYILSDNEPVDPDAELEEVTCLTLDTFREQVGLDRVDLIKISTEGNELAVLIGCEQILATYAPTIIYTNFTSGGINLETAQYLIDRGYELFRYQPYLKQLIPIENEADLATVMKAIAMPKLAQSID
jgi:FkbM family methyltransferase